MSHNAPEIEGDQGWRIDYPSTNPFGNAEEIQHWMHFGCYESVTNLINSGIGNQDVYGIKFGDIFVQAPDNVIEADTHNWGAINQKLMGAALQAMSGEFGNVNRQGGWGQVGASILEMIGGPGAALAKSVAAVGSRTVLNPRSEKYYESPGFRTFGFAWKFAPMSAHDSLLLRTLTEIFRKYSYPSFMGAAGSQGGTVPHEQVGILGMRYKSPPEWDINHVFTDGSVYQGLSHAGKCVLQSVNVNYTAGGIVQSYIPEDGFGSDVFVNLELSFSEVDLKHQHSNIFNHGSAADNMAQNHPALIAPAPQVGQ